MKIFHERKDEIGNRYGKLTVVSFAFTRVGFAHWNCICDCGGKTQSNGGNLRLGLSTSCGCSRKDKPLVPVVGLKFGRLLVVEEAGKQYSDHGRRIVKCRCDCGSEVTKVLHDIKASHGPKSCGCIMRERWHLQSHTPEWSCWYAMRVRCRDANAPNYHLYGGRGIKVCERWADNYLAFVADMGKRPSGKSLDRIDVNGNYELENCRWATAKEQAVNRRVRKSLSQFTDEELLGEIEKRGIAS